MRTTISEPVFCTQITVFIGNKFENFREITKKERDMVLSNRDADFDGMTVFLPNLETLMWIGTDASSGTMVHELAHSIFYFLSETGNYPIDSREETFCYLIGYYYNRIMEWVSLKSAKKKKTRKPKNANKRV